MKIPTCLAAVVLAAGVTQVQAAVVDFEDLTPTSTTEPCFGRVSDGCLPLLDSGDYRFTSPVNAYSSHGHLVSRPFASGPQSYASNGTQYVGLDPSIIVMSRIDGGAFSLSGFDAAEGFWVGGGRVGFATKLRIEGSRIGGGTATATVEFDGLNDGTGPGADFQSFALPWVFGNLSAVTFQALNAKGEPDFVFFSLDNLHVAAVPESAEWMVLSLGLGVIAARTHRRESGRGQIDRDRMSVF